MWTIFINFRGKKCTKSHLPTPPRYSEDSKFEPTLLSLIELLLPEVLPRSRFLSSRFRRFTWRIRNTHNGEAFGKSVKDCGGASDCYQKIEKIRQPATREGGEGAISQMSSTSCTWFMIPNRERNICNFDQQKRSPNFCPQQVSIWSKAQLFWRSWSSCPTSPAKERWRRNRHVKRLAAWHAQVEVYSDHDQGYVNCIFSVNIDSFSCQPVHPKFHDVLGHARIERTLGHLEMTLWHVDT